MRLGAREGADEADDSDPPTCACQACSRSWLAAEKLCRSQFSSGGYGFSASGRRQPRPRPPPPSL